VLKVGVGILDDLKKLRKDFNVPYKQYVDIGTAAKRSRNNSGLRKFGLAGLTKQYFNVNLVKPKSISMSNWETYTLSDEQISYAAYDALLGVQLYMAMEDEGTIVRFPHTTENASVNSEASLSKLIEHLYLPEVESVSTNTNSGSTIQTDSILLSHALPGRALFRRWYAHMSESDASVVISMQRVCAEEHRWHRNHCNLQQDGLLRGAFWRDVSDV
jgi:hypothetical protein